MVAIQPGLDTPKWLPNLPISDFKSTAQILKGLKCLVTVDTSTAHVAGALGVKTIMIAPINNTEARWAAGSITPWYDSMTIVHGSSFQESITKAKELLNEIDK
jgi:ADP-heptose:LPS heptosyltransferase